jgi:hypothetical protein
MQEPILEPSEHRMGPWREQKRREGYRSLTVWLKADIKHLLEDLAAERREDVGQVITAALHALAGARPRGSQPAGVDYQTVQRMLDARDAQLLAALGGQERPSPPVAHLPQPRDQAYGWLTRTMEQVAPQLGRFTNAQLAHAVQGRSSNVHSALQRWLAQGKVRREGVTYVWVGKAPSSHAERTPPG